MDLNEDPARCSSGPGKAPLFIHIAFICACIAYGVFGYLLNRYGGKPADPLISPNISMIVLAPGILLAIIGIAFYKKARTGESQDRMKYQIIGNGFVESLALCGLVVFFLTGQELTPLLTACGLAVAVMLMNFPG